MTILFWIILSVMILVVIMLLILPLLRVRESDKIAYRDSNVSIFDDKLQELETDLEDGKIDQAHFQFAKNELERELLIDVPVENQDKTTSHSSQQPKRQPVVAIIIAIFVPLVASVLYLNLGMYSAVTQARQTQTAEQSSQSQQQQIKQHQMSIPQMIEKLKRQIDANGGSVNNWTMLGRAYEYMKDYVRSSQAFAKALAMSPKSTALMLAQAESLAMQNNKKFGPSSRTLILKALKQEPGNMNAMWFAGVAEFQAGHYHKTISYLTQLADTGAVKNKKVRQIIIGYVSEARQKLIDSGEKMPALESMEAIKKIKNMEIATGHPKTTVQSTGSGTSAQSAAVLHVHITVSEKVKQKFKDTDDVFVYAKAQQGPKMPLAVKRMKLSQFPTTVVLSDSMAMMQGMNMSAFGKVIISARVTESGSAIAQAGDYIGTARVNDVHTDKTINLSISQPVE